jgi:excisionase family DNA binding protein
MESIETIALLKPKQVAKMLNVSPALVYKLAERKEIGSVRWPHGTNGKRVLRFEYGQVEEFIKKHRIST